ncbi:hypothetical protein BDZ45DRAFT_62967 [Acephala macrosclerotiorum]|nr:hypothetical protein BDZ45DRAFT_62967 [Acephala macrosclerotiorum]
MSIWVDGLWAKGTSPALSLGSLISFRIWPKLDSIHWDGISLHLANLERFMERKGDKTISYMSMRRAHLLSGTWADDSTFCGRARRILAGTLSSRILLVWNATSYRRKRNMPSLRNTTMIIMRPAKPTITSEAVSTSTLSERLSQMVGRSHSQLPMS